MPVSHEENLRMSRLLAEKVAAAGGRAYYVGGFVRDRLMGVEGKDIDLEIHGLTPERLNAVLQSLGTPTTMGASFGIFGLSHYDLDIAMPRKETATGRGHRDFAVFVDPFLGTEKAARRRDFTINALMQDVLTGEVLDHFGGRRDLELRVLRHVCDASFAEDPLRVLRAAQFAARLGFSVAEETRSLCAEMPLDALARERVFGEMEKALLKAGQPSVFFQVLRDMDQLKFWFPEVADLIDVPQDPRWHPEGDVWTHTMQVLDRAATLREKAVFPMGLMLSALCHDFGKPVTTTFQNGRIRSIGHETEGLPAVNRFLQRVSRENRLIRVVLNQVELHMLPNQLVFQHAGQKALYRLLDRAACPEDLLLLAKADRRPNPDADEEARTERYLWDGLAAWRELMAQPAVTGADLIAAGLKPGKMFKEALAYAHKLHLAGQPKDAALKQTLAYMKTIAK